MTVLTSTLFLIATVRQNAPVPASVQALLDRPNVFASKKYVPSALPPFEQAKSKLPEPILQIHPEWVQLYWKAWELAFHHLKQPEPGSGFVSNFVDPAFNANTFQWDTCFMVLFAHYAEPTFHAIGSLDNFYAKQHDDGYICREISRKTGQDFAFHGLENTINPPLFSWVEWQNFLLTGDQSRFESVLPRLVKYYSWLKANRRRPDGLYWNTGLGAGEDDLVRNSTTYSWLDMSAQQVQNAYYISLIAHMLKDTDTESYFKAEAVDLSNIVNLKMWDPKIGFYYDLKQDGSKTGIKTVLGFWPLLAHIASTSQAKTLVSHLLDPNEFLRPDAVPALAANEPGYTADGQYWNGAVWAPTNYMVVKGLQDYGFEDEAEKIAAIYLANMAKSLKDSGTIWENYAPEFAEGHGVRDMVGWSGLGPISMLIENIIGVRTSAANNQITWRIRLKGENGVKNLTMGSTHVSLFASVAAFGQRDLTVTTDAPFTLKVDNGDKTIVTPIKPGTTVLTIDSPYVFTMTYPILSPDQSVFNLALHHKASASSTDSIEVGNLVDGKGGTRWVSGTGLPQSVTLDLEATHLVRAVNLVWDEDFASSFNIETSLDGLSWKKAYESTAGKGGRVLITFTPSSCRYLRLNCLAGDGAHQRVGLAEIQVIGR
jgi:hypothetical protein